MAAAVGAAAAAAGRGAAAVGAAGRVVGRVVGRGAFQRHRVAFQRHRVAGRVALGVALGVAEDPYNHHPEEVQDDHLEEAGGLLLALLSTQKQRLPSL